MIAFAAEDGNILIYDVTDIVQHDLEDLDKENASGTSSKSRLIQRMSAHCGAEISCIALMITRTIFTVSRDRLNWNTMHIMETRCSLNGREHCSCVLDQR